MSRGPDFRIIRDHHGDYMVCVVEDDEAFNTLLHTFATREQAEAALADLERAEAEEDRQLREEAEQELWEGRGLP